MTQGKQDTTKNSITSSELESWTPQQFLQMQSSLIELAQDVILVRDPTSHIIFWNHGAEKLYGLKAEAAVGQVTHDLLKTRFPENLAAVDAALEQYGKWEGELIHTCANGTRVIVDSHQVLMRNEQGQPYVILEVNRDITVKKAEQARFFHEVDLAQQHSQELLKESAERLQLAQRAGNIGTFEFNILNEVILWTPELEALYGLHAGEFTGAYKDWMQRIHPDDLAQAAENLRQALLEGGAPYNDELRIVWPDSTIHWVLAKGEITSYDEGGKPIRMIGVNIDITRLKEVEQALQHLNANLEERVAERTLSLQQLNKELQRSNQELQDFAYVASHDLQEPLRKIQAFGNLLQEEYEPVLGEGKEYIDRMRHAATRMRILIDDLLAFSRVTTHALPFSLVNLNTIAAEVMVDLEVQVRDQQGQVEIGPLPTVYADPAQMRQLLQNLLGNALKFRQRDTPPIVNVWAELLTDDESFSEANEAYACYRLCVKDNGIGFNEKYLDRIFTVFQRLHGKNIYEGTGIGLAIVRKIAERHNGTITAKSSVGQGSTFIVTLPAESIVKKEKKNGE
ncbi:MAG TPA: PAS domain-containing protein [Ktedonobacteraceae bacterium]